MVSDRLLHRRVPATLSSRSGLPAPSAPLRVLVVDDDVDDAALLVGLLREWDRHVVVDVAHTFDGAQEAIRNGVHRIYLIDYRLGAEDGVELIRQTRAFATGPFVLLTGTTTDELDDRALAAGASDFLEKESLTTRSLGRSIRYAVGTWSAMQNAAREQERYRSLFEGVPVGLFRTSPEGRILEANPAMANMLGCREPEALLGVDIRTLVSDSSSETLVLSDVEDREMSLRGKDGSGVWVTMSLSAVRGPDGRIQNLEGVMLDVSRRRRTERQLSLQGSILDLVEAAIIQTDAAGFVTHWNSRAEQLYGWTAGEALGRPIVDLTVPDVSLEHAASVMEHVQQHGHWEGEFTVRRRDGSTFVALVSNSLVSDDSGNLVGTVGMSRDISELTVARNGLASRVAQEEALARLSRLAVDSDGVPSFLRAMVEIVADALQVEMVGALPVDPGACPASAAVVAGVSADRAENMETDALGPLGDLTRAAGGRLVVEDMADHPAMSGHVVFERMNVRSCVAATIGNEEPWGVLGALSTTPRHFRDHDIHFIEAVANLAATVIGRATIDARRNRLAEILEATPDFVGTADAGGRIQFANSSARRLVGLEDPTGPAGLTIEDFQPTWAVEMLTEEAFPAALSAGVWSGMTAFVDADGREIPTSQVIIAHQPDDGGDPYFSTVARDLTRELERERRLGESEALVGRAFDGARIGMCIAAPDGTMLTANQALESFLGYPPGGLVGRHITELTHPEDVTGSVDRIPRLVDGSVRNFEVEKRYVRADGEIVWGLLHVSVLESLEDGPLMFGQVVDIHERKVAEERIRFQASLLDQVRNAVVATDMDGRVTYWNKFAEEMFGWTAEEMFGAKLLERIFPGDAGAAVEAAVMDSLAVDGTWTGEAVLCRRDGTTLPAWMSESLIRDAEGMPVGVVGVKIDMSEVRQAEDQVRRQGQVAESVLRSVRFPVAVLDRWGRIAAVNREWVSFAVENGGTPAATGVGVDYLETCRLAGDDQHAAEALVGIEQVLSGEIDAFTLQYPCHAPDEERWFEMDVSPIPNAGAVVVHWDVTEQRHAQAALEEAISAKDQFIASLSHELRTPLTAVMGLAEELRTGTFSAEEMQEFHGVIAEQAQEVALLVEDLLVAARISSGTLSFRPSLSDVVAEIQRVVAPWSSQEQTQITLGGDQPALVWADAGRVRQILRNLVGNAVRHGMAPIEISVSTDGDSTSVTVVDRGEGIPDSELERMFEPYATFANEEGRTASVGLGLHVSRGLAEQMGGTLTYARADGRTIFELTLPARQ